MVFQIEKFTGWRRAKKTGDFQLKTRRLGYAQEEYDTWDDAADLWRQDRTLVANYLKQTYADTGDMLLLQTLEVLEDNVHGSTTESEDEGVRTSNTDEIQENETKDKIDTQNEEVNRKKETDNGTKAGAIFYEGQRVQAPAYMFGHEWSKRRYKSRWRTHREKGTIKEILDDDTCAVLWDGDEEPLTSAFRHLEILEPIKNHTIKMIRDEENQGWTTWVTDTLVALTGARACCASLLHAMRSEKDARETRATTQEEQKEDERIRHGKALHKNLYGLFRSQQQAHGPNQAVRQSGLGSRKNRQVNRVRFGARRSNVRFGARRSDEPNWRSKKKQGHNTRWGTPRSYANANQRRDKRRCQRHRHRVRCAYCTTQGHTQQECKLWNTHKKQMHFLRQGQQEARAASCTRHRKCTKTVAGNPRCTYCGEIGHTKGYCKMRFGHEARRASLRQEHLLQRESRRERDAKQQGMKTNRTTTNWPRKKAKRRGGQQVHAMKKNRTKNRRRKGTKTRRRATSLVTRP